MHKRVVIVGAVAAGPKTACRLRRLQPDWHITMIDQDSLISYGGCGIPYYVGGDVSDESELRATSFHVVRDASFFAHAKGVEVMTSTRAVAIDRANKILKTVGVDSGEERTLPYDALVLATGAAPVQLPLKGAHLDGVFTIASLHKAIAIKERVAKGKVGKVVVIGGGAIGIEMAESMADLWGLETALVEFMPQVLPKAVDWPMAKMLETHLRENGVEVFTGESVVEILDNGHGGVAGVTTDKRTLEADLVIMAAGVRPRSELAREAGLDVTSWGGIKVNMRLQTSDPDIYAAGDCIATTQLITGKETFMAMGSLANRQGRVVADNIAGKPTMFKGVVSSFIMKGFERCIGSTGITYESALAEGYDADYSLTSPADRAHFFPGQAVVIYLMVFDRKTRRVLGVQGFGMMNDSVSARIDAAAALLSTGGTIDDFGLVEMAYAPPFSSAIDSLNGAAYTADNLCDGRMRQVDLQRFLDWMEDMDQEPGWAVLDIRHPREAEPWVDRFGGDRWVSMNYEEVRARHGELPEGKTWIIVCNAGTRSYEVQVFLDRLGKTDSLVLGGGLNVMARLGVDWFVTK
ncbi:MAG: pyridine nucleotide-disulfide oxidoreductase [Desulfobulbus propionicus]|nr:MAG: pyridine nucleotide-disulfide oxidoreductase [Desulfobulbus propionicus]